MTINFFWISNAAFIFFIFHIFCILHFHIFWILHFHIFCILHFHIFWILHFHIFCILHFHIFWILHYHIFCILHLYIFTFPQLLHFWAFVFFLFPLRVSFSEKRESLSNWKSNAYFLMTQKNKLTWLCFVYSIDIFDTFVEEQKWKP